MKNEPMLGRPDWEMTRFGAVVQRVDERLPGARLPLMSVSQTLGVIRRSEITDKVHRADSLDVYKICRRNDVVFNKMSVGMGAMGVAREVGLVTYHYEVMRPRHDTDPRYIVFLMKSLWFTGEMLARERGIAAGTSGSGVRTTEIPFSVLRTIKAPMPPPREQRRIADFLEIQVARIDQLIGLRGEQARAAKESVAARLTESIESAADAHGWMSMRRIICGIEQGWSPQCESRPAEPQEYGVLKLGAVRDGAFHASENKVLPKHLTPAWAYHVSAGDLLISRANTPHLVGDAAVVPINAPANLFLPDLLYRVRLSIDEPEFVSAALRTKRVRGLVGVIARGTSQTMVKLRGEDIAALPIPAAPSSGRRRLGEQSKYVRTQFLSAEEEMQRQVALLRERKRSLITAAVTGEFDVSTASGRGVA